MQVPAVEVVVRVHNTSRPVRRAVASVLDYPQAGAVVVAHGVAPEKLDLPWSSRVRVVHEQGGLGLPGFASNAGFRACRAEYVGLLDSDDFYEPGALSTMHRRAMEDGADVVLAPLKVKGQRSLLPLTTRSRKLRAERDRLFYRTAPLGLIRREVIQDPDFRFDETVRVGEDMRVSVRLWTTDLNVSYHFGDPCYVVTDDAEQRVTLEGRSATESLAAANKLLGEEWVRALPPTIRSSLATKLLRVHLLAPTLRATEDYWTPETLTVFGETTRNLLNLSPDTLSVFAQKDALVLEGLASENVEALESALILYRTDTGLRQKLPRKLWKVVSLEANLRNVADSFLARRRPRRLRSISSQWPRSFRRRHAIWEPGLRRTKPGRSGRRSASKWRPSPQ